jgi:subtilisin family serine protease
MGYDIPSFNVIEVQSAPSTVPLPIIPYGVKMIGVELEWPETKGDGIRVAVVDTGAGKHPDLVYAGMIDVSGENQPYATINGHGIHTAGTIGARGKLLGVAPGCELYSVKVFKDQGGTSAEALTAALKWCRANKMDIISMSLGGPYQLSSNFEQEMRACYAEGIVMVASAGNNMRDWEDILYPARYPEVLAVAAVDIDKNIAQFSSWGQVDISAAGVKVYSTWLDGKYAELDGTSMACPHITGAIAIIQGKAIRREGKKLSPDVIRYLLRQYGEDVGDPGPDVRYGCGVFSFGRLYNADRPPVDLIFEKGKSYYFKNGIKIQANVPPIIINDRLMIGLRDVSEALDCDVMWQDPCALIKG